jgi:transposase InsO family protein
METRELIRRLSAENPRWGAPRIHGEFGKLGVIVSERTVAKYMVRTRKPPSQTWRAFLRNHAKNIVAIDFFTVTTAVFRTIYVLVVIAHERRRVIHFAVTEHPTAAWTAQQMVNAFPWEEAPRFLLRDRDGIYGAEFLRRVERMGIEEELTAPQSPWQNPIAERHVGSVRRECLDHMLVFNEAHLERVLLEYFEYYNVSRCHLSLDKDAPEPRSISPPGAGRIVAAPILGGLHHVYDRQA